LINVSGQGLINAFHTLGASPQVRAGFSPYEISKLLLAHFAPQHFSGQEPCFSFSAKSIKSWAAKAADMRRDVPDRILAGGIGVACVDDSTKMGYGAGAGA
jgi:hypothetical protein